MIKQCFCNKSRNIELSEQELHMISGGVVQPDCFCGWARYSELGAPAFYEGFFSDHGKCKDFCCNARSQDFYQYGYQLAKSCHDEKDQGISLCTAVMGPIVNIAISAAPMLVMQASSHLC